MADAGSKDDLDETPPGLENVDVVTKYKTAGEMANRVINTVKDTCKVGSKTIDLCRLGDMLIEKEVAGAYNKKGSDGKVPSKGVAFPTCISINHCVCHNSPLLSDPEIIVAEGDLVKIDLAVHIDGFIAPVGTTFVVGEGEVTGKKADVIMAAHVAAEVALRMMRPGAETYDVTDAISKVAAAYGCTPLEGMLSHQLIKNKIDGEKAVIQNPTEQLKKEHKKAKFEENEVYGLDIIMTTGADGKAREGEQRTTVFKATENVYGLKMKASRAFNHEMKTKFNVMPFTLRACEDEKTARLGVTECVKHDVVDAFKILWERDGEFVAQFKMLVLVTKNGNVRGTLTGFNPDSVKSDKKLEFSGDKSELGKFDDDEKGKAAAAKAHDEVLQKYEELNKILNTTVGTKNKKKKKKKNKPTGEDGGDGAAAE